MWNVKLNHQNQVMPMSSNCDMANIQSCRSYVNDFTWGRITGKLEKDQNVTSVVEEFRIAHTLSYSETSLYPNPYNCKNQATYIILMQQLMCSSIISQQTVF